MKATPARGLSSSPRHLVWLSTGFIGDVLLSTAGVAAGMRAFPRAQHHLITTEVGAAVAQGVPGLASVTVFAKRGGGLLAAVRSFIAVRRAFAARIAVEDRAEVVLLQAHLSYRSGFLARFLQTLGFKTVNFHEAQLGGFAAARVPRVAVLHEAERVALLLTPLGVPRSALMHVSPSLSPLPADHFANLEAEAALVRIFGGASTVVAIAPGSVWATKRWTPEGFAGVLKGLLRARPDVSILLLGSRAEEAVVADVLRLAALSPGETTRVVDLTGKTELDELRRIFPRLALLVVNDSSLVHYASAFGVPTVALFGPTTAAMGFAPRGPRSVSLGVDDLACRPCSLHGPMRCPLVHFRCMKDLDEGRVLAHCLERLPTPI